MFTLYENRTRDLLHGRRVFPPLRQFSRHLGEENVLHHLKRILDIGIARTVCMYLPSSVSPSDTEMRHHMCRLLDVVHCNFKVPLLVYRRAFHSTHEDVWTNAGGNIQTFFSLYCTYKAQISKKKIDSMVASIYNALRIDKLSKVRKDR
jgi:hypothetical protein